MFPTVKATRVSQQFTDTFYGYNHNMKIRDGEFYEMQNLSSDNFPLLSERPKRGVVAQLSNPRCILGKSKLAYIDGANLYYDGVDITSYLTAKGLSITTANTMISMGAYLIIYPDKLYINTENYTDCGGIESNYESSGDVSYAICKADGTPYGTPVISSEAPASPSAGDLWIDASGTKHFLKQWNAVTSMWVSVPTVYTKISCTGIGANFNKLDGVTISGCAAEGTLETQVNELNGTKIIYEKANDYVVVVGLLDSSYTQTTGTVKLSRLMPELDYITEAQNRLWGCKYGLVNGKTVNEIYCSALGDFKNWNKFLGIATDSYVASVGTDGEWTGAVTHLGYPLFFKENVLHKVYVSSSGAHKIVDTACRGVQKGCNLSLQVVNEALYYKSHAGVCVYDGSLPELVSEALGETRYKNAVSGTNGNKYYISMTDYSDNCSLFVLDTAKRVWHREDDTKAVMFARCGDELYYIDSDKQLIAVTGSRGTAEGNFDWYAVTGLMGYMTVEQEYISRFNLRMRLPQGSTMKIFTEYDSNGEWIACGEIIGTGTKTFMLPVRPRRCDHFRIRIEGNGSVRIYSFAKIFERGSDG